MNEFVKRIIMEQIYSSEVLDGYKIDDKGSFCEEILSQIPEEKYEGIVNDEENDYIIQLITNLYNRKLLANKIFYQVEETIKFKNILVDRTDVYNLVISLIPFDRYDALLNNRMDAEFIKIVDSSVESAVKNESTDKKYDRELRIFGQNSERTNMSTNEVLANKSKLLHQIEMLLIENKERDKEYSGNVRKSFEFKGREQTDAMFRQQAIRKYISDKLASYRFTFNDFDQEINMLVNKYFSNDMSYFNLINGIYDTAIFDIVLIDSKEFINIKEDVARILKLNEKKFKGVDEDTKKAAILMTTSALCSMAQSDEEVDFKNIKLDEYIHEQLCFNNNPNNNYRKVAVTTLYGVLKGKTKSFKEIMNELRGSLVDVDWKGMMTIISLLTLGAATNLAVPVFVGGVAFLRKFGSELEEFQSVLQKENDFFNGRFGMNDDSEQSMGTR